MRLRLWPFRRSRNNHQQPLGPHPASNLITTYGVGPDFFVKHHALRALCGVLMDGHSQCLEPGHPFCSGFKVESHHQMTMTLIGEVACEKNEDDDSFLVAIYLSKAVSQMTASNEPVAQMDYIMSLNFAGPVPDRKMVVRLLPNGDYLAYYGPILDPVPGDYSTGHLDWDKSVILYGDPEPAHAQFTYWPSGVTEGQQVVPQFKCLMENGQWWVADVDPERQFGRQVAGLEVADNPEHLSREISVYHASKDA